MNYKHLQLFLAALGSVFTCTLLAYDLAPDWVCIAYQIILVAPILLD